MFFEFFDKRPMSKFFYFLTTLVCVAFGVIANSVILYVKLRQHKGRTAFEWIVACIMFGIIAHSATYLLIAVSVVTHGITNIYTCYLEHISGDFSNPMIIYPAIILMVLIKFNPQVSVTRGFIVIGLIWICAVGASYPFYRMFVVEMPTGTTYGHNVCMVMTNSNLFGVTLHRFELKLYIEFVIPSIVIFAYFLGLLLFKTLKVVGNYDIWIYAWIIGTYYCIVSIPVKFNMLYYYFNGTMFMNFSMTYLNSICMMLILIINPAVYLYCNRRFFRELCEFFNVGDQKDDEYHEIFWDGAAVFTENEIISDKNHKNQISLEVKEIADKKIFH